MKASFEPGSNWPIVIHFTGEDRCLTVEEACNLRDAINGALDAYWVAKARADNDERRKAKGTK